MQGVIYTANGPQYVEQALVSIASVRRWSPDVAVGVFTDQPGSFDAIADIVMEVTNLRAPNEQRMLPRLESLPKSPFERTLALDTDTVAMGPIDEVFDVLDRVSVGICHGHQRARRFSAALRSGKALPEIPYAFPPVQGGVILYDDSHGREFVYDVAALYKEKQYIDDQVSMREVLWRADYRFAFLGPEYNIWQLDELDRWSQGNFEQAWPKIFHTVTLKQRLSPSEIDQLLLPLATRASRLRQAALIDGRPSGAHPMPPRVTRLRGLRSTLGHRRARHRLLRRANRKNR